MTVTDMASNETNISEPLNGTLSGNNITTLISARVLEYVVEVEILFSSMAMICNIFTCCIFKVLRVKWNARLKLIFSLCVADFFIAESQFVQAVFDFNAPILNYLLDFKVENDSYIRYTEDEQVISLLGFIFDIIYNYAQAVQQIMMMCLAVDLMITVKNPLRYSEWMSSKRGTVIVTCTWVLTFAFTFFAEAASTNSVLSMMFLWVIPIIGFFFLGITNLITFYEIRKLRDRSPRTLNLKKSALTLSLIVVTYVTCMMPIAWLMVLLFVFRVSNLLLTDLLQMFKCLLAFNAMCDPIIYACRMRELNPVFGKMFGKCPCSQGNGLRSSQPN